MPAENRVQLRGLGQLARRKDGGNWHASFSVNGQQFRETTRTAKYNEAVAFLKRRITEIATGTFTKPKAARILVPELLQDVLDDYRMRGRLSTIQKMVKPIIEYHLLPAFKHVRASNLTVTHIRKFITDRQAAGAAPATINRGIAVLRRAYSLGVTSGKVNAASVPQFKTITLDETGNERQGFWEHAEYIRFRDALPPDERAVFVFGYWTGCRLGEILEIEWTQVDFAGSAVRLREIQTKSKEARIIPLGGLGADLYDMLVDQRVRHSAANPTSPYVFFRSSRAGGGIATLKKRWYAAQEATGITRLFHDLRRTGVRNLVRAGVPEKVAMLISGHKTRSVFERYNIVDERDLHDAAEKLNGFLRKKKERE